MHYVISDLHGEYEKYKEMLSLINFKDEDVLYVLGDVVDRGKHPLKIIQDMMQKTNVIPLIGNHDIKLIQDQQAFNYFESVDCLLQIQDGRDIIYLCHYPMAEWPYYHRNTYHIYGHIHNNKDETYEFMSKREKALNAACMINNYEPVTLEELIINNNYFKKK